MYIKRHLASLSMARKRLLLSPAVLNLVTLHRLDPLTIQASGPKNNLLKGDVLAYLASPAQAKNGTATFNSTTPPTVTLLLTRDNLQALAAFVSEVDLGSRMTEQLLAKAVCHAAAQLVASELTADLYYNGHDQGFSVQLGGPMSHRKEVGGFDNSSAFLVIDFHPMIRSHAAPLNVAIHRLDDAYSVKVQCTQAGFDLGRFVNQIAVNISDPHAMLL